MYALHVVPFGTPEIGSKAGYHVIIHVVHRCRPGQILQSSDVTCNAGVLQYYPPFAPNFIRLNEVLLPVDPPSTTES